MEGTEKHLTFGVMELELELEIEYHTSTPCAPALRQTALRIPFIFHTAMEKMSLNDLIHGNPVHVRNEYVTYVHICASTDYNTYIDNLT